MNSRCRSIVALPWLFACLAIIASAGEPIASWPDFRGPRGDGHSEATGLPWQWSEQQNVAWKTPLPGRGWSSPVVWGDQVWMTTATEDGHRLSVLAVDLHTGRLIRELDLFDVAAPEPIDTTNSYASPSPVIEAGRVYVHFGTYGTACIATDTGKIVWARRDFPVDHQKGPGSSPVLFEDLLIFQCDGNDVQYIVALEKTTGDIVWRTDRSVDLSARDPDYRKSFSTPLLLGGEKGDGPLLPERPEGCYAQKGSVPFFSAQLISTAAGAVFAYDPRTGRELWRVRYSGHTNVARPVTDGRIVVINTGYARPQLWTVRLGGSGDITDSHVVWRATRSVPTKPSPLLIEGRLYLVTDLGGILSCLDAATGTELASRRLGGNFAASPLYADGRLYLCNEEGRTVVVAPDDELTVLADNRLDDGFLASPAVAGRSLLLRGKRYLYRIDP
jgi:outer membrane protein assembly factor BamB